MQFAMHPPPRPMLYAHFHMPLSLPSPPSPTQADSTVSCRSTNYDRTLKTLSGVLTGLFPASSTDGTVVPVVTGTDLDEIMFADVSDGGFIPLEGRVYSLWRKVCPPVPPSSDPS